MPLLIFHILENTDEDQRGKQSTKCTCCLFLAVLILSGTCCIEKLLKETVNPYCCWRHGICIILSQRRRLYYFLLPKKKGGEFSWGNWMISAAVLHSHWSLFCFCYQIKSNRKGTYFHKYPSSQLKASEILTWNILYSCIKHLYRVLLWPFSSSENI